MKQTTKLKFREKARNAWERVKNPARNICLALAFSSALGACGHRKVHVDSEPDAGMPPDITIVREDLAAKIDSGVAKDTGVVPEAGPKPPKYSYTIKSLIGEYVDSELLDREDSTGYGFGNTEVNPNANPLSDGQGGNIGQAVLGMFRIDEKMFQGFAPKTIQDVEAFMGIYREQQDLWIRGSSSYSEQINDVAGRIENLTYSIKFHGKFDESGIPVCTSSDSTDRAECLDPGGYLGYVTARHMLRFDFLGDEWAIMNMEPPAAEAKSEFTVVPGGKLGIAKWLSGGIININKAHPYDGLQFQFSKFNLKDDYRAAIISVLDSAGNAAIDPGTGEPIIVEIEEGETKEVVVNGKGYRLCPWQIAPGYTPLTQWISLAILSEELTLEHGKPIDEQDKAWTVYLGWKNKDASETDTRPDHLRSLILHANDIGNISSSGSKRLSKDDSVALGLKESGMELRYDGLTEGNPSKLRFELIKSNLSIPNQVGSGNQSCTLSAPYVKVSSAASGYVFKVNGAGSNEFVIATSGGQCDGVAFDDGALFMKESPNSSRWVKLDYSQYMAVEYPILRDGAPGWDNGSMGTGFILYAKKGAAHCPNDSPDFLFSIRDNTGMGSSLGKVSETIFGLKLNGALSSFNIDVVNPPEYACNIRKDRVSYNYSGPVSIGWHWAEKGFITERGTTFTNMSDTMVEFQVGETIVYSQFPLVKK